MSKKTKAALDNDAAQSTPARTYQERLEQALMWVLWELDCDQNGHGGVTEAARQLLPEFDDRKLTEKGYPRAHPESYDPDPTSLDDDLTYRTP